MSTDKLHKSDECAQIEQQVVKEKLIEDDYKVKLHDDDDEVYKTLTDPVCEKSKLSDVWETSHTPPLESTLTKSPMKSSNTNLDDKIGSHDDPGIDEDNKHKLSSSSDLMKDNSNYRMTDDYETYLSCIEKDICTEFDNPMYIPIKLPLSSNLYVPVYYVQSSEEASPKSHKHNVDYNDSNINNSTVSHKFILSDDNTYLRGNDSPAARLEADHHINTNNQGYDNYVLPHYTSEISPDHCDLKLCQVEMTSDQLPVNLKHSGKKLRSKSDKPAKEKTIFKKTKSKTEKSKDEQSTPISKNKERHKDTTGCSPRLKIKKKVRNNNDKEKIKRETSKKDSFREVSEKSEDNQGFIDIQNDTMSNKPMRIKRGGKTAVDKKKNSKKLFHKTTPNSKQDDYTISVEHQGDDSDLREKSKNKIKQPKNWKICVPNRSHKINKNITPIKVKNQTNQENQPTQEIYETDVNENLPTTKIQSTKEFIIEQENKTNKNADTNIKPKIKLRFPERQTKLKASKAGVKVEGEGGAKVDLDAGLDAHIDGKASKGGKKFHWSPKFGFPKGGLKIGGGAKKPDASISVSAPTGGVDVSVPKPDLDVSLEVPDVEVSASVPEIGVSGGAGRGGELGVTGQVSAPDVDVSVPSKKFTFGWGSKGKKAKKAKLPKVSGDIGAGVDVSGKVDVPSVEIDLVGGSPVVSKKSRFSSRFPFSRGLIVTKSKKPVVRFDPTVSLPSGDYLSCSPTKSKDSPSSSVDTSYDDSAISPDFMKSVLSDEEFIPPVVSFKSSATHSSRELLKLDDKSKVKSASNDFVDDAVIAEEPVISPVCTTKSFNSDAFNARFSPPDAFQEITESFSSPVDSGINGDASNDETVSAEIDEILIVPIHCDRVLPKEDISSEGFSCEEHSEVTNYPVSNRDALVDFKADYQNSESPLHTSKHVKRSFWPLSHKKIDLGDHSVEVTSNRNEEGKDSSEMKKHQYFNFKDNSNSINVKVPKKKHRPKHKDKTHSRPHMKDKHPRELQEYNQGEIAISISELNDDLTSTPRRSPSKFRDPSIRKTWHGAQKPYSDSTENIHLDENECTLTDEISDVYLKPRKLNKHENSNSNVSDFLRRSVVNSAKRRPWSTLEYPPPECHFVDDDYLFPDALTPTKIPSFRASKEIVYDVPYMDDKALPTYEPEWPLGESRRTLISQLSQNSLSMVRITAEEESSLISLDTKLSDEQNASKRKSRFTSHFGKNNKKSSSTRHDSKPRSKSSNRLLTWWSKHSSTNK
ncbi:unnamed protein product [Trichobilharzia szidati]|nr:unnamed protein product [Trichobilharzia szidati]CAH8854356.1 unnamed protein product [Trichobilharzia szidati]